MASRPIARLIALGSAFSMATIGLTAVVATPALAAGCAGGLRDDVNGDGHAEVAITDRNQASAGSVHVLYGQTGGLVVGVSGTALDDQQLSQNSPGVQGASEGDDEFGSATVFGDFNGDGCADLAVGVPGENDSRGRVVVFYGSPAGLRATGVQAFSESSLFGAGAGRVGERFGATVAAADFDGNGVDDLVVGAPGESVDGTDAGAVVVLPGARGGLATTSAALLSQSTADVPGASEDGDGFGTALAAGDFDGSGVADLAIGVPGENGYGTVVVLDGAAGARLGASGSATLSQKSAGVPGAARAGDNFAGRLAAGDINGDDRDDLAIGVPAKNGDPDPRRERFGEGAVVVVFGSATGVTARGSQVWSQGSPGVEGRVGPSDQFGASLAVAPLDTDGYADLAIGASFDAVGSVDAAGSVTVLRGGTGGLTTAGFGGTRLSQDTAGVDGSPGIGDFLGYSIAAAPVQSPTQYSLVVGVPFDVVADEQIGLVNQFSIGPQGPTGTGSRSFNLNTPGLKGKPGGGFGFTVG